MDYKNGKIYKIQSSQTEKIYIGSTAMPRLCQRLAKHMSNFRDWIKNNENVYCTSYEILKFNHNIILLENYPCNNKDQLHAREEYWRLQYKNICVNKNACFRTAEQIAQYEKDRKKKPEVYAKAKEFYRKNKETLLKQNNEYKQEHRKQLCASEKLRRQKIGKVFCEVCCKVYMGHHKSDHEKTKNHLKFFHLNKQLIKTNEEYSILKA